jgi:phosphoribosyl 1,2-cyclic phosphodiesterase
MSLQIASLNSGSNGNCYYVGSATDAVLIDAGISCRETERRMQKLGLVLENVRAIFISHEHTDHTRGVQVLSRKHNIPVYITESTHRNSQLRLHPHLLHGFDPHEILSIGELKVTAFPKRHDAMDPHSFVISGNGTTVGVMTDIGSACEHVVKYFRQCNAVFLEANYDEIMLETGGYPLHLKRRIRGEHGHLSNKQALQIFESFRSPHLSHLILSHLSENNNDPDLVYDLFKKHAGKIEVAIASRFGPVGVFCIGE